MDIHKIQAYKTVFDGIAKVVKNDDRQLTKRTHRIVQDFMFTRYACYLIAQRFNDLNN